MKNVDHVLPNHRLNWAAYVQGKRESRRLLGDVVLSRDDLDERQALSRRLRAHGLEIDLHLPDTRYETGFEGEAFISKADSASSHPAAVLDSLPLPLFAATCPIFHGRPLHQRDARGPGRGSRDADRRLHGRIVGRAAASASVTTRDPRDVYAKHLRRVHRAVAPMAQEVSRADAGRWQGERRVLKLRIPTPVYEPALRRSNPGGRGRPRSTAKRCK